MGSVIVVLPGPGVTDRISTLPGDHDGHPLPARRRLRLGGAAAARQGGRSYTTRWDTTARIEALCAAFLPDYFPRTPREQVPEYGDAITIAQALVTGHTLPVTGNL